VGDPGELEGLGPEREVQGVDEGEPPVRRRARGRPRQERFVQEDATGDRERGIRALARSPQFLVHLLPRAPDLGGRAGLPPPRPPGFVSRELESIMIVHCGRLLPTASCRVGRNRVTPSFLLCSVTVTNSWHLLMPHASA